MFIKNILFMKTSKNYTDQVYIYVFLKNITKQRLMNLKARLLMKGEIN